jgi:hypothetical protein
MNAESAQSAIAKEHFEFGREAPMLRKKIGNGHLRIAFGVPRSAMISFVRSDQADGDFGVNVG